MNQILVTERIYVTPELKRKKKMYRLGFILCIMVIVVLTALYIYSEYERYMSTTVADDLLSNINFSQEDDNSETLDVERIENALVVAITPDTTSDDENLNTTLLQDKEKNLITSGTYVAPNGKEYSIIGIVEIPKINVKYPIIAETTDALLKVSVCKFWGPEANEVGNLCLVGHNYKNSKFFSKVPKLSVRRYSKNYRFKRSYCRI